MRFLIFLILVASLALFSCKKKKEAKVIGTWELLPQNIQERDHTVYWTFMADQNIIRVMDDTLSDTGTWSLEDDFFKYFIKISDLDANVNANYWIEKVNNEVLILQAQSPYIRKELVKHVQ